MFYLYGLFRPSLLLELGINNLKEKGFTGKRLLVVVLDHCPRGRQRLLDSMYSNDGMSLVDGIAIGASMGMLFGVIYGSLVTVRPIALGLTGMFLGGGLGYLLDISIRKKKTGGKSDVPGEVIVAVLCHSEEEAFQAERIFKDHLAVALGRGPVV